MARTVAGITVLKRKNVGYEEVAAVAADTTDGLSIRVDDKDRKFVIAITNASSTDNANVTIKKGDNEVMAVADLNVVVGAGTTVWISLDSMRYKQTKGVDKDLILLTTDKAVSVKAIKLP